MRRILIALATGTLAAAVVGGVSLAEASVQPASSGIEHMQIVATSATSHEFGLIATGEFTAVGTFDSTSGGTGTVTFPGGTLKITSVIGHTSQFFNQKTCLLVFDQDDSYTISDGTGIYASISGSGTSQVRILGVTSSSNGTCTRTFTAFQEVITGKGPIAK